MIAIEGPLTDAVRDRLEKSHDRAWGESTEAYGGDDVPWIEDSYPPTTKMTQGDFLTAEEALASEEQYLGKRGIPDLDDDVPNFLHIAAKAGPAPTLLDHLGRTPKERKERKIKDAIALGEARLHTKADSTKPLRATTILRDHDIDHPDLYMAVYVVPDWDVPDDEARFAKLFARSGCYRADTVEDADLVIFGGGSDVEPLLYGEKNEDRHPSVYFNVERDAADMKIYLQARSQGTPMMGVCRGAQFLHVMNGGKLNQDIDGHQGAHKGFALKEKLLIENVSSVHHQSCIIQPGMEVLMTACKSSVRWLGAQEKDERGKIDVEAFYYRDTGCFGVQGHPEYANCNKFSVWCLEKISDLFLTSPDFTWDGKRLSMTATARDAQQIAEQYVENAYNQSKEA